MAGTMALPRPDVPFGYADAVNAALEELKGYGPEFGPGFAVHAPMAAEALAQLGYGAQVDDWLRDNITRRDYSPRPAPSRPLDPDQPDEWRAALGQSARFADWAQLFDRELADSPWPDVLTLWWPRLLPGLFGGLTHGLIRTAHAVRGVASVTEPTPAQLGELAQGLAFWASRYSQPPTPRAASPDSDHQAAGPALRRVVAEAARTFAEHPPAVLVPMVHSITAPAAMDLVLPVLPTELHETSYQHALWASSAVRAIFGRSTTLEPAIRPEDSPPFGELVAAAMELGDEHAIKLVEACVREDAASPDESFRWAAATLIHGMREG